VYIRTRSRPFTTASQLYIHVVISIMRPRDKKKKNEKKTDLFYVQIDIPCADRRSRSFLDEWTLRDGNDCGKKNKILSVHVRDVRGFDVDRFIFIYDASNLKLIYGV